MELAFAPDPRIAQLTETIVSKFAPLRVVLFGSRARGDADESSDYDIMVEFDGEVSIPSLRTSIYDAIHARKLSADIHVRTSKRFYEMRNDPGYLDWDIAREGRVLFERGGAFPLRPSQIVAEPKGGWPSAKSWQRMANEDFLALEALLVTGAPTWNVLGFHAQQYVEKLLKVLIIRQNLKPERTHKLSGLVAQLLPLLSADPRVVPACDLLDAYYPRSRYPADDPAEFNPLTEEEAVKAVAAAKLMREIVLPLLEQES